VNFLRFFSKKKIFFSISKKKKKKLSGVLYFGPVPRAQTLMNMRVEDLNLLSNGRYSVRFLCHAMKKFER